MAKLFIFAVVVALACQASYGKPADSALDTLAQSAKTLTDELSQTLGLQNLDTEKLGKTLQDQSKAVAEGLQSIVDKLKAEVTAHQPERPEEDLKKSFDPKTQKQIDETRQKFDDGLKTSVAELQKLAKSVQENKQLQEAQTNIQSLTKSVLDTFVSSVKNAETQLKKAIDDHEKTHKH
ncbi:Apolipophorin-III precursor (apoLp-III) [Popillia japonica]|uniref:Apolipophorin-III (ApoLp-III) n=1 Tax=Popillia japonica TaxID=7064 RepID=A0AAW1KMZ5_POPJA